MLNTKFMFLFSPTVWLNQYLSMYVQTEILFNLGRPMFVIMCYSNCTDVIDYWIL